MTAVMVKIALSEVAEEKRIGIEKSVMQAMKDNGLTMVSVGAANEMGFLDMQFAYDKKGIIVEAELPKRRTRKK